MKILEHNVETGEVIERDATAEEVAIAEETTAAALAEKTIAETKAAAAASAIEKLAALGLTADEIAALRG